MSVHANHDMLLAWCEVYMRPYKIWSVLNDIFRHVDFVWVQTGTWTMVRYM